VTPRLRHRGIMTFRQRENLNPGSIVKYGASSEAQPGTETILDERVMRAIEAVHERNDALTRRISDALQEVGVTVAVSFKEHDKTAEGAHLLSAWMHDITAIVFELQSDVQELRARSDAPSVV
jgi:hypothetical protein